jgi:drug/metabolite transporter (DMT)-like permease
LSALAPPPKAAFPTAAVLLQTTLASATFLIAKVAIFMNLQPVLTAALSVALLDEALTAALLGGGAMVLGGVVLVQRR